MVLLQSFVDHETHDVNHMAQDVDDVAHDVDIKHMMWMM
jgi:hypothetical protein